MIFLKNTLWIHYSMSSDSNKYTSSRYQILGQEIYIRVCKNILINY